MSDAQIKAVTDAITAFEADATQILQKLRQSELLILHLQRGDITKLHQTLLKQLNQLMPH